MVSVGTLAVIVFSDWQPIQHAKCETTRYNNCLLTIFAPRVDAQNDQGLDAFRFFFKQLPRVRRHRASSPQGKVPVTGAAFAGHPGRPINVRLSFPTSTLYILYQY